jgi:hypothetical protein
VLVPSEHPRRARGRECFVAKGVAPRECRKHGRAALWVGAGASAANHAKAQAATVTAATSQRGYLRSPRRRDLHRATPTYSGRGGPARQTSARAAHIAARPMAASACRLRRCLADPDALPRRRRVASHAELLERAPRERPDLTPPIEARHEAVTGVRGTCAASSYPPLESPLRLTGTLPGPWGGKPSPASSSAVPDRLGSGSLHSTSRRSRAGPRLAGLRRASHSAL